MRCNACAPGLSDWRFVLSVPCLEPVSGVGAARVRGGSVCRARRRVDLFVGVLLVLWLLFFPNAPYLLSDFIHLSERPSAPLWYDALMLSAFAWTALLLGFASLYLVQMLVRRFLGSVWSWLVVGVALALASFGVYLGRFMRFNSWDALLRPRRVADVIGTQLENPFHSIRGWRLRWWR